MTVKTKTVWESGIKGCLIVRVFDEGELGLDKGLGLYKVGPRDAVSTTVTSSAVLGATPLFRHFAVPESEITSVITRRMALATALISAMTKGRKNCDIYRRVDILDVTGFGLSVVTTRAKSPERVRLVSLERSVRS